ncbi:hypothetical protein BPOR_1148g00030 [Botrytis porri]|uniref:Uncharacterized protein n=1 Tax=Botrytis porri TaxID=87229 RepID=A0A4Z1KD42_9HELO|nr:hypothetical protein BPOR_1148g00030 [Botrytis porri]
MGMEMEVTLRINPLKQIYLLQLGQMNNERLLPMDRIILVRLFYPQTQLENAMNDTLVNSVLHLDGAGLIELSAF